eukprot:SAG31_NODE_24816_length_473_cov_1.868984_1_plen_78_part_10
MTSREGSTSKHVTPLLAFLARYRERRNVLTGSKNIPGLWWARFQSFFKVAENLKVSDPSTIAEARSAPEAPLRCTVPS